MGLPAVVTASYALGPVGRSLSITGISAVIPGEIIQLVGPFPQTYSVDLAMVPAAGLKALCVDVDPSSSALVTIRVTVNGTTRDIPITPGGWFDLASPTPGATNGVTALQLLATAVSIVTVTAYA